MPNKISFFVEDIKFRFSEKKKIKEWISNSIISEGKILKDISIIFCSDEYLLKMNNEYLKHDFYTDIITFDYTEGEEISGDLFISIDRVKDNSKEQKVVFEEELNRVMIHGVLHLCGYKDKTKTQEVEMRAKENIYLNLYTN